MVKRIIIRRRPARPGRRRRRRQRRPRRNNRPSRRNVRVRNMRRRGIPAAYARQFRSVFRTRRIPGGLLVYGRDLMQPLPQGVPAYDNYYLFTAITCNPCYWTGTRIAALAAAHQNYRPLHFRATYIPQVAVTQAGTVLTGTNWNTLTSVTNFQQSMVTSNGGCMSQCYVSFDTRVALGSNLQQNLYNCSGPLDIDHNPFNFMAFMRGADVIPGYFYISYAYILKNPVGQAVNYSTRRALAPDYGLPVPDKSILLLGGIANLSGPGLMLDVESDGAVKYHDSEIAVPDGTPVIVYESTPAGGLSLFNEARSILVTDTPLPLGSSYVGVTDYAAWNWNDDTNTQVGKFRPSTSGGQYGWSWYFNEATSRLTGWADSVAGAAYLFYYAIDTLSKTITALIVMQKAIAGTRASPSAVLSVEPHAAGTGVFNTKKRLERMVKTLGRKYLTRSAESDASTTSKKVFEFTSDEYASDDY